MVSLQAYLYSSIELDAMGSSSFNRKVVGNPWRNDRNTGLLVYDIHNQRP